MDWESEGTSAWLYMWLCAQHWIKHAWICPPLCSGTQLQHFMVEENTTVCLGSPRHSQSQHSGPWGPPLRQGFPGSLNDGHTPQSGQLALNPQRKRPGIGPYWKFLFNWVVDDLKGPFWLGNPLRLWNQSTPVAGRHYRMVENAGNITESSALGTWGWALTHGQDPLLRTAVSLWK